MTQKRTLLLNALKGGEPLSASQLAQKLPKIDLVTIYRNLELFVQAGIVKRLQFEDEALYEYQEKPHHHALCENCHKMIHFSVSEEKLRKLIDIANFSVTSIDITVKGVCIHEVSK